MWFVSGSRDVPTPDLGQMLNPAADLTGCSSIGSQLVTLIPFLALELNPQVRSPEGCAAKRCEAWAPAEGACPNHSGCDAP